MITINFLQTTCIPKTRKVSLYKKLVFVVSLTLSLVVSQGAFARVPEDFMTQPTLLYPAANTTIARDEFIVKGLAYNWAFVDIFIDGGYAGRATTKNSPKGIESFSFKPASIASGTHFVQALVRSETEVFRSPLTMSATVEIVDPTPAPTLFTFAGSDDFRKPYIRGIAANHTTVSIFVDGKLDQEFQVEQAGVSAVTFSVKPKRELANGFHTVTARSTATNGVSSKPSSTRTFLVAQNSARIVERAPGLVETPSTGHSTPSAPTLVAPKTGSVVATTKPAVTGFAHNDLLVRSFVDGNLDQEFNVKNHPSGTTQFTFLPQNALKSGDHKVYVQAEDQWGNRSTHSNEVNFLVRPEGAVPVFSPSGVSSRTYPPLVTPLSRTKATTTAPVPTQPEQPGTISGDAVNRNVNANTNAPPTNLNQDKTETETSRVNTRKIIGWIILGISILGIIAYIISALIERKKNKERKLQEQKAPIAKAGINFTSPASAQPDQVRTPPQPSQPTQAPVPGDIPDLDDDIPKGYQ